MPAQLQCQNRSRRLRAAPSRFSVAIARPRKKSGTQMQELSLGLVSEIAAVHTPSYGVTGAATQHVHEYPFYRVTFPTLPKASLSVVFAVLKAPLSVTPKAPIAVSDSKQTSTTINAYSPRSCPESSFHRFGISVSPFVLTSLGWRQSRD
jgi:hypothetical protein